MAYRKTTGAITVKHLRRHSPRLQASSKTRLTARNRPRPNRQRGFLVAAIIILVAVAASIFFYESNPAAPTATDSPQTLVTGTVGPYTQNFTFTSIFFISTTTQISYSAPINNVTFSIRLFSSQMYNVTIEIQASDGHHFCSTLPPSINVDVTGAMTGKSFACFAYGGPGI